MNPLILPGIGIALLLVLFFFVKGVFKFALIGALGFCAYRIYKSKQSQPTKGILLFCTIALIGGILFIPSLLNGIFFLTIFILLASYFLKD